MTADAQLESALRRLRRGAVLRALLIDAAAVAPLALGLAAITAVLAGRGAALLPLVAMLAGLLVAVIAHRRRHHRGWLWRALDRACPRLEDSSALALQPAAAATPLAQLQQARIRARLSALLREPNGVPDLRAPWPRRRLLRLTAIGAALMLSAALLPTAMARLAPSSDAVPAAADAAARLAPLQIRSIELAITPPAYTGLPVQQLDRLDAVVPAGSELRWRLRFDQPLQGAVLRFHDGSRVTLMRDGEFWTGARVIDSATVYRLETTGAAVPVEDRGYRLDARQDQPPVIEVRAPEQTLTVIRAAQPRWSLQIEARDDYGLGEAELLISHAQGQGDQVKVAEQRVALIGEGDDRARRYAHSIDLAALGYAQGDDLIVKFSVADRRAPQPQTASSASLILRWAADSGALSEGLDGAVQKVAPAYFRSQRQIIIDTEALIAARPTITAARLAEDADTLGVDQKILRLRYGEFLGEEFENGAPHEGEGEAPAASFGREGDVLHEFGHEHNESEAATLMDPATKVLLRAALNEMWQAELQLRQAAPDAALPYEYKALDLIKQVQQAERIYLARSGLELPPFDATRRLSGERDALSDRSRTLDPRLDDGTPFPALLQALEGDAAADTAPLLAWLKAHPETPNALDLLADADRVQREPSCRPCRRALAARLWPLLPPPPARVQARRQPDAAGQAWLDALSGPSP